MKNKTTLRLLIWLELLGVWVAHAGAATGGLAEAADAPAPFRLNMEFRLPSHHPYLALTPDDVVRAKQPRCSASLGQEMFDRCLAMPW